jgi:AraC-like DNA-binding protein
MLLEGGHSVKEAGLAVGYKSLSNFSKAFRHVYGVLPGDMVR